MAEREAAKAAEEMRHMKEQEEKQKAVMEEFRKPPDRTPDQLMADAHAARRPGRRARTERGPDLSLSKFHVQRWWPKDQQLASDAMRIRVLGQVSPKTQCESV